MKISRNRFHQSCATLTALAATAAVVVLGAGPFAASASAEPAPTVPPGAVFTFDPIYVLPAFPHLPTPTVTTTTVPPAVGVIDPAWAQVEAAGDDEGCDGCLHPAEDTPDPIDPLVRVAGDTPNPEYTHSGANTQGSPGCGNDPASPLYQPCPEETTTTTVPNSTTSTTVPESISSNNAPSDELWDEPAANSPSDDLWDEPAATDSKSTPAGVLAFTGSSSTLLFLGVGVLLAGAAVLVLARLVRSHRVA